MRTDLLPSTRHCQQKHLARCHSRRASSSLADFSCISWKTNRQFAGSNQAQDLLCRDAFECACTAASGNQQQTSKAITLALRIGALHIRNPLAFLPRRLLSEASEARVRYDHTRKQNSGSAPYIPQCAISEFSQHIHYDFLKEDHKGSFNTNKTQYDWFPGKSQNSKKFHTKN